MPVSGKNQKLNVNSANLQFDCCYEDISRVKNIISNNIKCCKSKIGDSNSTLLYSAIIT